MAEQKSDGFWGWAKEHWFLTFLLAGSAIAVPANIISAMNKDKKPEAGGAKTQAPTNVPVQPPTLRIGDIVKVPANRIQPDMTTRPGGVFPEFPVDPFNPTAAEKDIMAKIVAVADTSTPVRIQITSLHAEFAPPEIKSAIGMLLDMGLVKAVFDQNDILES
jgi:hypothetical protein